MSTRYTYSIFPSIRKLGTSIVNKLIDIIPSKQISSIIVNETDEYCNNCGWSNDPYASNYEYHGGVRACTRRCVLLHIKLLSLEYEQVTRAGFRYNLLTNKWARPCLICNEGIETIQQTYPVMDIPKCNICKY